jgi:hypothetical protein
MGDLSTRLRLPSTFREPRPGSFPGPFHEACFGSAKLFHRTIDLVHSMVEVGGSIGIGVMGFIRTAHIDKDIL